ncbi:biopolymer transporter ExbD [Candidatus Dependentiae bacterium]|nr:biopolymer transporter ExbD [Candidatus Dependentiae bacterium]
MIRRFNRRNKLAMPEVTLTPLIDTALTLLVIFMVATPMLHNAVNVELPRSQGKAESEPKKEDLVVYIDKKEKFYLNDSPLTLNELIASIKKKTNQKNAQTVFVKADKQVSHGTVCEFVDRLKYMGGIKNVALATQVNQRKES